MKTMRKEDIVVRVREEQVEQYLADGYYYCPKHVWKKARRPKRKGIIRP